MASLDNPYNAKSTAVDVPGRPDQIARVWLLKCKSISDTLTVPELDTRSAVANQSSALVLDPASGFAVSAAATTSNNENVLTILGGTFDREIILFTLHPRNNRNTVAPDPA